MKDKIPQKKVTFSKEAQDILIVLAYVIDNYGDVVEEYPEDSFVEINVIGLEKFHEKMQNGEILLEFVDDPNTGNKWWRVRNNIENNKELLSRLNDDRLQEQENSNPA